MPAELPVHVNRDGLHSIEVPASFEAEGSFDVRLINHGEAAHVHLHLEDALSGAGAVDANNHYVKADSERFVRVKVADGASGLGKLKVATSYGAETRYVDVDLSDPDDADGSVRVDESLSKPQPKPEPEPGLIENSLVPVAVLGILSLLVAAAAFLVIQDTVIALAAAGVVVAVAIGIYVVLLAE